jgi:hypothetical protein
MKTLKSFAEANGLKVAKITYRHKNYTWTGYDLVNPKNGIILASFEPKYCGHAWGCKVPQRWPIPCERITDKFLYSLNLGNVDTMYCDRLTNFQTAKYL